MKVGMLVIITGTIMFVVGLVFFYSIELGQTDPVLRLIKKYGHIYWPQWDGSCSGRDFTTSTQ